MVRCPRSAARRSASCSARTVDRVGIKRAGLARPRGSRWSRSWASLAGTTYAQVSGIGVLLGVAGGELRRRVALASRWYPPEQQGLVLGIAGAGNSGTIIAALAAPRIAAHDRVARHVRGGDPRYALLGHVRAARQEPPQHGHAGRRGTRSPCSTTRRPLARRFYLVTFGGFVGFSGYLPILFADRFGLAPVTAASYAALCASRDRSCDPSAARWRIARRHQRARRRAPRLSRSSPRCSRRSRHSRRPSAFVLSWSASFGVGNGAVFQLVGRRFPTDRPGHRTRRRGGRLGGFLLRSASVRWRAATGSFAAGFARALGGACSSRSLLARNAVWRRSGARAGDWRWRSDGTSRPDIPRAKRAGLDLDLDAVCAAGPARSSPTTTTG